MLARCKEFNNQIPTIINCVIKVGDHQNQHIIKINKFALNGDFNCIIAISDALKY